MRKLGFGTTMSLEKKDVPWWIRGGRQVRILRNLGCHQLLSINSTTTYNSLNIAETGCVCLAPRPSAPNDPVLPAMPMRPFYGIKPHLINPTKDETTGTLEGPLCLEKPWPGMAQSIWNDSGRFQEVYFKDYPPYYFTGDGAVCTKEGYWKITGRMDDVINVTGHRLGTAEVEEALVR